MTSGGCQNHGAGAGDRARDPVLPRGAAGNSGCEPRSGDRPEHGRPGAADRGHSVQICFSSGPHLWAYSIAALYGIELALPETIAIALAIGVLSFYSPGIPSGGLLVITPVFVALDLPVEGIGLLIAVDLIIDMFITGANIAANMAATLIIERSTGGSVSDVTE